MKIGTLHPGFDLEERIFWCPMSVHDGVLGVEIGESTRRNGQINQPEEMFWLVSSIVLKLVETEFPSLYQIE